MMFGGGKRLGLDCIDMRLLHVVGARPNFMKIAPVMTALGGFAEVEQSLVHTGQHYDRGMSQVFFEDLGIPRPDVDLGIGSDRHGAQTGRMMIELERVFLELSPDCIVVVGDVNSTMAAALVATKLGIPSAHVEAGLRSFDRTMPEEINRIVTDQVAGAE
jgi:UDP-N-acetylglucosamine 2-epimerase (non-hydrolysing)